MAAERKPVDKLKFTELKDEAIYLNALLEKNKDFKSFTIKQLQTEVRKWRLEADEKKIYHYNPEVKQIVVAQAKPAEEVKSVASGRSTKPLAVINPVKETKSSKKKTKKNKVRTVRPMGASDTLSADIIRMHEEGKTVMEIYASDPVRFKYNTVYMIIKRFKARAAKLAKQKS